MIERKNRKRLSVELEAMGSLPVPSMELAVVYMDEGFLCL